eukprot:11176331-Lingulodinium_polyedra.AAC.1
MPVVHGISLPLASVQLPARGPPICAASACVGSTVLRRTRATFHRFASEARTHAPVPTVAAST